MPDDNRPPRSEDTGLNLMPDWLKREIPALYFQDGKGDNAVVYAKFFTPWTSWTWFVTEYDPEERRCFGLVVGHETELGYWDMEELESVRGGPGGAITIERDVWFEQTTMGELRQKLADGEPT